jgi:hypothetical protein
LRKRRPFAIGLPRRNEVPSVSPEQAVAELRDIQNSIGDICPECPADLEWFGCPVAPPWKRIGQVPAKLARAGAKAAAGSLPSEPLPSLPLPHLLLIKILIMMGNV